MRTHLTTPQGPTRAAQEAASVPGMAHFAATGPEATCRQCAHWGAASRPKRDENGYLKPRQCQKYRALTRTQNLDPTHCGVPAETPACKYFERAAREARHRPRPVEED